ncbi:ATP-dependent RNA helicase dbp7 [Orbilia blumenaviensis]|uniref:ATP-dependent RNA helicase n=1 Tax=Orbilia blumenaviensis TaxID=1796055 RepID=A0AAV9VP66_9PEZI
MAEPDILVNFDLAPAGNAFGASSSINGIRGGRWKDRFRAKKRLQNKRGKSSFIDADGNQKSTNSRSHSNAKSDAPAASDHDSVLVNRSKAGNEHGGPPRSNYDQPIISSIFSSNPAPVTKADKTENANAAPAAPTNAPLKDGSAFSTMGLAPTLASHLVNNMNISAPTSIQQVAVPQLISSDSDAFIQAETGSGKTLTYLLPLVHRIYTATTNGDKLHRDSGCFAIILAPTRELGRQIYTVLMQLLSHPSLHWLVPILILGGEKKKSEKARIRKGGNILVATPGRLADHLSNTTSLDVGFVKWLVLDEGDRLMELGFEETLQQILTALNERAQKGSSKGSLANLGLPDRRITVLCSATMKASVQKLGDMSLKDALYLKSNQKSDTADDGPKSFQAPAQLKQAYIVAPAKLRLVTLASILRRAFVRKKEHMKVIVFFSCADSVDFHYETFSKVEEKEQSDTSSDSSSEDEEAETEVEKEEENKKKPKRPNLAAKSTAPLIDPAVSLFKLHGSLAQHIRTTTLNDFFHEKDGAVLFCTDVASRGLDLPNVDLVVQYDPPYSQEDYIHRIGRTARAGRDGRALLFLLPGCEEGYPSQVLGEQHLTRRLADEVLKKGFGNAPLPGAAKAVDPSWKKDFMPKTSGAKWEQEAIEFHLDVERRVLASGEFSNLAKRAFQSHIRAYATHVAAEREVFDIKQLHLGHIAKSFGLRERPGDIKVPARGKSGTVSSTSDNSRKASGKRKLDSTNINEDGAQETQDEEELRKAAQMMRKKMREHMNIASEFNIG